MPTFDKTWEWITERDAKVVFALAILAFVGMTAWRGWIELSAGKRGDSISEARETRDRDAAETLPLKAYEPLGLLGFITNQAGQTVSVPLNPFRPTAEEIVARIVEAQDGSSDPVDPTDPTDPSDPSNPADPGVSPGTSPGGGNGGGNRGGDAGRDPEAGRQPEPAPKRITYRGVFRRTDGVAAAWIEDADSGKNLFYPVDEKIHGVTVLDAGMRTLTLRLPDDTEETIELGQALEIPQPAATATDP